MKVLKVLAVASVLMLAACTTRTDYGSCVGIGEKQNPKLHYKASAWNITMSVLFVELIAPPVVVALNETYCPVGPTEAAAQ
jgi:hypothetical protein